MAAAGLYGLVAYDTNQRTREFGIRAAIGASRGDVAGLLMRELLRIEVPGVVAGLVLCYFLVSLLAPALYGVKPYDPGSFAISIVLKGLVGPLAAWRPVQRAMSVDPAIVLRDE
jgi:putative ABC transport system permease protein